MWRRPYETRRPEVPGFGPALSRFGNLTGEAFGLIHRDSRDRAGRIIEMAEIERRSLASIRPIDVLRLVDLTGDGPLRMGVRSDVVGARDQSLAMVGCKASRPLNSDGKVF